MVLLFKSDVRYPSTLSDLLKLVLSVDYFNHKIPNKTIWTINLYVWPNLYSLISCFLLFLFLLVNNLCIPYIYKIWHRTLGLRLGFTPRVFPSDLEKKRNYFTFHFRVFSKSLKTSVIWSHRFDDGPFPYISRPSTFRVLSLGQIPL